MTQKKRERINRHTDHSSDGFATENKFFFSSDIEDWNGSRGKKSRAQNKENYNRKKDDEGHHRRDFHLKHG